jgi:23S rRNA (cytosine1962-C5)-methyltransferase
LATAPRERPGVATLRALLPTATVRLKKDLARAIRRGHPWVYRDALAGAPRHADGALVEVLGKDGRYVGTGYWDASSAIAVRILGTERGLDWTATLARRLTEALERRLAQLDLGTTNAFRWVHGEADRLPGVHVDIYADVATVRFDGDGARAVYRGLPEALQSVRALRVRDVIDRDQRAQSGALEVVENGLKFVVDLAHGQKGGLFLDQRENRAEVAARAPGLRVLNLFGYTGGFSLYAAAAGALRTDTVDVARPAIAAARRNFELNGLPADAAHAGFHAVDAFDFLESAARRGERFGLVVSDPPAFAKNRAGLSTALAAYRRLHALAGSVVEPGGIFCAASCSSQVDRKTFLASVEAGVRAAGRRFTLEQVRGAGFDHPVLPAFPEGEYLKFAIGRVL